MMAYDRNWRGSDPQRDFDRDEMDHGSDYGSGRDYTYSSARDYRGAGDLSRNSYGGRDQGRSDYGRQDYGSQRYGQGAYGGSYGGGDRDEWRGQDFTGGRDYYRGDQGDDRSRRVGVYGGGDDNRGYGRDAYRQQRGTYGRQQQGQDQNERGFMARAADEVRSWIGDEEAERRREQDARRDEQQSRQGYGRDEHYHSWRNQQIASFDRDYDEYRQENQSKFHNEFAQFRTERQGQRDLLGKVEEHAEVVGSDGEHVGTVDKIRGDRIILTKNDQDAGGHHHSIPSRWLQTAESNKVTLRKTAAEAKQHWRDEERQDQGQQGSRGVMFGGERDRQQSGEGNQSGGTNLNRSFSGTY